jgi:hypothetical protein
VLHLPAVGFAGGVNVAWNSDDVRVVSSRTGQFSMSVQVSSADGPAWWLTAMYGPTVDELKPLFLDELCRLRAMLDGVGRGQRL